MEITLSVQSFLFILFSSTIFMNYIHAKWISFYSKIKKSLPPSPPKLPIIGNFHQLGSSPHRSLHDLSQNYGPIMLLHLGSMPMLIASSSEVAEEIMKTHDSSFASRPDSPILDILLYGCKDIAFSPSGEYWRQLKSIVVSNLLNNAQVKSFHNVREKEIDLLVGVLEESCGSLVNMSAQFVSLAEKVICTVTLGKTFDGLNFTNLLRRYLNMFNLLSVGSYIPWLSWVDQLSGLEGRAKAVVKEFDEFLEDVIKEHVEKERGEDDKIDGGQDFIDMLLKVQKDDTTGFTFHRDTIKVVILDVFGGGIDSVSTSLEWIMSELVKNPKVMKKLQKEVTQIAQGRAKICEKDLEKMQYLKAVIKENWRLHPTVPLLLPRKSTKDVNLMGYDIQAGTQAMVNVWAIGRDPTLWEDSTEFKPERFLKNSSSTVNYKGLQFEWLPFGAGRRACPGTQFAASVIELAIANIVYKFDLALLNGVQDEALDMTEIYGITVHRKYPLLVIASPRF